MSLISKLFPLTLTLTLMLVLLSGCVGSHFMYGEDAPQGSFPNLHDVPDEPASAPIAAYEASKADMTAQYEKMQAQEPNNTCKAL